MKMEKPQKNVGNAHSTKLFYPFCECLGTFSTLISYFFSLFYFSSYLKHAWEGKHGDEEGMHGERHGHGIMEI